MRALTFYCSPTPELLQSAGSPDLASWLHLQISSSKCCRRSISFTIGFHNHGLNWAESKWPGHFCSIVLNFFASKICVKLPPEKKVPWHWCWALLSSRWNSHFSKKNAFFGQKKAFFQKVHFIQIWSVTPNTIFECIKNDFLLYNPKLVFFTEFNLAMVENYGHWFIVYADK